MALVLENAKLRRGAEATRCKLQQNWSIGEALGSRGRQSAPIGLALRGKAPQKTKDKGDEEPLHS